MEQNKLWAQQADTYWLRTLGITHKDLPNKTYTLEVDPHGIMFLKEYQDRFNFDYKLYGLEKGLIDRVVKTANAIPGNLGILLNGLRGTGKTVTAKQMCNALNLPVVIIDRFIEEGHRFINEIPQDIIVLIDEYEKIFEENYQLLSIMDGAMNSNHKRIFILTTNELYISENLIQRPGRIRYLKTFRDLSKDVIAEIVDDILEDKNRKESVIGFISTLEMITVDVVKTICQEVNIHKQNPEFFEDVFNVKKISGKFDVYLFDEKLGQTTTDMPSISNIKVYPYENFDEGDSVRIDTDFIGDIIEIFDENIIKVRIDAWNNNLNRMQRKLLGKNLKQYIVKQNEEPPIIKNSKSRTKNGNMGSIDIDDDRYRIVADVTLQISRSETYHRMYRWPVY